MKGRRGFAISPNYPNQYPNNLDCQWTIQLAREYHVKLTQLEFDLPPHNEIAQCDKDHVELRDGLNVSAPLIATFCGAMENQQYESRYNQLLVRFVSDGITDPNRSYKGSKAHYEAGGLALKRTGLFSFFKKNSGVFENNKGTLRMCYVLLFGKFKTLLH